MRKFNIALIFIFSSFLSITVSAESWEKDNNNADKHPLKINGPLTNPYESLVIGNGDLAVSASVYSHELVLQVGKTMSGIQEWMLKLQMLF